jgi:hypothetical protein
MNRNGAGKNSKCQKCLPIRPNGVDFSSLPPELGRPMQKGFLAEALRRLGISPALLFDHHVIILVHINPELDDGSAPVKLGAGSLK